MVNGKVYVSLKSVPYGIVRKRGRHFINGVQFVFLFPFPSAVSKHERSSVGRKFRCIWDCA